MMALFHYLIPSLPFLRFGDEPPLSPSGLCQNFAPLLSEKDSRQLQYARLDIEHIPFEAVRNETFKRWIVFENSLRNELVRIRAQRLGIPPEAHMRTALPWDPSLVAHARDVLKATSPLEAEMTLLEVRWQFLSDLEVGHYFDLDALIVYLLKLHILERIGRFDEVAGREILRRMVEEHLAGERKDGPYNGDQR